MRWLLVVLLIAGAWLGRDQLLGAWSQTANQRVASAEVYQWRDAQGQVHFGDAPAGVAAKRMDLKPLNTMPGMTRAELDSSAKRAPSQPDVAKPCEADEAACWQKQRDAQQATLSKAERLLPPNPKP